MSKDAQRRLSALETRTGAQSVVYAVSLADVAMVAVCGTDERLTVAAFRERYPAGIIVKSLTCDLWKAI